MSTFSESFKRGSSNAVKKRVFKKSKKIPKFDSSYVGLLPLRIRFRNLSFSFFEALIGSRLATQLFKN